MDVRSVIGGLSPLERKVLPLMEKHTSQSDLIAHAGLKDVEVMRAIQWLSNKDILTIKDDERDEVVLDENGLLYLKEGLPEKRFLRALASGPRSLAALEKEGLSREEVMSSLGVLKGKLLIALEKKGDVQEASITEQGRAYLKKDSLEEVFLKKKFPILKSALAPEEKFAFDSLLRRKRIIRQEKQKDKEIHLTSLGKELMHHKALLQEESIERLSRDILLSGSWKGKNFRTYDVEVQVPKISGGRKHFDNEAIQYIRRIWLDMGFSEMTGNIVQTAFWDLDALFVPQDHPAREMQDTFYLKKPKNGKVPQKLLRSIKEVHENGSKTGSRGWRIPFSEEVSKKLLLRTHTTVLSAQTIAGLKKSNLPAKFFSVGKVFRNEATDWKHDFELYQVEGIVVDPDANLSHLKGYLKEFYRKMGFTDIRMRPGHFPYTEPSMEIDVYNPKRKVWIELGGSGIFRPEVVIPLLGEDIPVLAWGQGMGRIMMAYYGLKDIREIYKNDLEELRAKKVWFMKEEEYGKHPGE